jgi:hypothetical protein
MQFRDLLSESFCIPDDMLKQSARSLAEVYERKGHSLYEGDEEVARFKRMSEYPVELRPK